MQRVDALTGMRGVASLMVAAHHAVVIFWIAQLQFGWPADAFEHPVSRWGLGAGWLGVDFFFVLSGFLLGGPLLLQKTALPGWPAYRVFAAKRLLRIVPPYYASFVVAYAFAGWSHHPVFDITVEGLVTHLLYIHNFWLEHEFAINGAAWTLPVELQFYLLLPLMVVPFRRFGVKTAIPFVVASVLYLVLVHDPGEDFFHQRWKSFQIPAFLGHFAFGIAAAHLAQRGWVPRRPGTVALSAFAVLIVLPAFILSLRTQPFEPADVPWAYPLLRIPAGLAFAVGILCGLHPEGWLGRLLTTRPLLALGDVSYSLYLVHLPVAGLFLVSGWRGAFELGLPAYVFIAVVSSLVVSVAFYAVVERPSLLLKDKAALVLARRTDPTKAAR